MNINNKLCILAITAASVFVSVSTHAVPDTKIEVEKQKQQEEERLREKQAELDSLMLLGEENKQFDCPKYPFC